MKTIGVIGRGVVGDAVANAYEVCGLFRVLVYDIVPEKSNSTIERVACESDIIITCMPTPAREDGSVNLDMLDDALERIGDTKAIVVVSSTVPPGTFDRYERDLVSMPEFLVTKTARADYIAPGSVVIGGRVGLVEEVRVAHREMLTFHGAQPRWYFYEDPAIPQMIKYAKNFMLASKVVAANLVYDACEAAGIDFEDVKRPLEAEHRIGGSAYGFRVPGDGGKRGFGGACFPKDVRGFLTVVKENEPSARAIREMLAYNDSIRNPEGLRVEDLPGQGKLFG